LGGFRPNLLAFALWAGLKTLLSGIRPLGGFQLSFLEFALWAGLKTLLPGIRPLGGFKNLTFWNSPFGRF
jgi:hypothetical protein